VEIHTAGQRQLRPEDLRGGYSIQGKGAMDKPTAPKTAWPLHIQEIKQRTLTLLEDCARKAEPFGFFLNTERVTEIMRSGAAESFRAIVEYCESQPDFLAEQLDEIANETVTATLCLTPLLFRSSLYKESVPAIREALKAELQAVLRQRKERAGAFSKRDQVGAGGASGDKSNLGEAGPPVSAGKLKGKGRKRGPKPLDHRSTVRVAEIVARVAPDGDWRLKLNDVGYALDHGVCTAPDPEVCDVSDHEKIPVPRRWSKNQNTWLSPPDRATMVKAIEYRLEIAGKNLIKKTLS
jgi:hypothetical protein